MPERLSIAVFKDIYWNSQYYIGKLYQQKKRISPGIDGGL